VNRHARAFPRQSQGNRPADSFRAAGDHHDLSVKRLHGYIVRDHVV
jgi:hypothetical protein